MTTKYTFQFNKLVRDKAPSIMRDSGMEVSSHTLDQSSYVISLRNKIKEEAEELFEAEGEEVIKEIADVVEVAYALAKASGFTLADIEKERLRRIDARGGFENKQYVSHATLTSKNRFFQYYTDNPTKYPKIKI